MSAGNLWTEEDASAIMSEIKATRTVTVTNDEGVHLRAATLIAELARGSQSDVVLVKNNERAPGSEVLQIVSLGTGPGDTLALEATGIDAEQVVDAIAQLFADNFGEGKENTEQAENQA